MYQINIKALKAVTLFASKNDVRYYLKGVHISTNAGKIGRAHV